MGLGSSFLMQEDAELKLHHDKNSLMVRTQSKYEEI